MHAAVITGAGSIELLETPDPAPAPRGVVVDITLCGICGTDVHAFRSGHPYPPAICGHEWTGTVSAVGAEVTSVDEGDRVVVAAAPACGRCAACRAGQAPWCRTAFRSAIGRDELAPPHGGFAPRIAVAADRVVRAHPALTDVQAALVEPTTVALHAVRTSHLRVGDTAVVQGAGPIGLATLQLVAAGGVADVVVVEPDERRRRLAVELGARTAVAPGEAARAAVEEATSGLGADIVFECAGLPSTIQSAVDLARRGGSMCLIGLADGDATITPSTWLAKELRTTAALAYVREEFAMAMAMIADGRLAVDRLHTGTVALADIGATFDELASGRTEHVKVLVAPGLEGQP